MSGNRCTEQGAGKIDGGGQGRGYRVKVSCLIIVLREVLFTYLEASGLEKRYGDESTLALLPLGLFLLRISGLRSPVDEDPELEGPPHLIQVFSEYK